MQNIMYSLYDVTGIFQIGKAFICIIMLPIIYKAEDVIKTIFGLQSKNLLGAAAVGLMTLNAAKKGASMAAKGANKLKKAKEAAQVGRASGSVGGEATKPAPTTTTNANAANNMAASDNSSKDSTLKKGAKGLGRFAMGKNQIAKKLASDAMGMALGYGLTGDYDTARAGKAVQQTVRNAGKAVVGGARLSRNLALKEEDMLDAYERLKDKGYTDEKIYHLTEDILQGDEKEITDNLIKEYAETINVMKDTQMAISEKEGKKIEEEAKEHVLEIIQKHILK